MLWFRRKPLYLHPQTEKQITFRWHIPVARMVEW